MDQKTLENQLKNCKVRQGPLYKRSKFLKQWRERWIVLTMNYLFTFTNKSCKEVTDIIDLKEMKSYKSYLRKDEQMIPAGFKVRSDDQEFYFCGRNSNQKWSWIVTLQRLMDYKYAGSSTYNNIQFVKTRGFISQVQFENGGKVQKTSQLNQSKDQQKKSAQEAKKQVDNQVQKIMKQLENQKQQLKQKQLEFTEKQKVLKEQQQALKKQQQQKIKQLQKKVEQAAKSPKKVDQIPVPTLESKKSQGQKPLQAKQISQIIATTAFGPKVSDLKSLYEQKMRQSAKDSIPAPAMKMTFDVFKNIKKKSVAEELHSLRSRTVTNLFEEFHNESPQPEGLIYTLDFLVKMASDTKFGYYSSIVAEAKSHKNRKFLAETFVQMITDYKDLENCDLIAKFIQICVFQVPGFFEEKHISIIQNKLVDFFLAVQDDGKLEVILKNMFIVNKMQKYSKNQIVKAKVTRISKESKRQETKNWARKLIEEF